MGANQNVDCQRAHNHLMGNRRTDRPTADIIEEALQMKRAFGDEAACRYLSQRGIESTTVERALVNRYDPRQRPQ